MAVSFPCALHRATRKSHRLVKCRGARCLKALAQQLTSRRQDFLEKQAHKRRQATWFRRSLAWPW